MLNTQIIQMRWKRNEWLFKLNLKLWEVEIIQSGWKPVALNVFKCHNVSAFYCCCIWAGVKMFICHILCSQNLLIMMFKYEENLNCKGFFYRIYNLMSVWMHHRKWKIFVETSICLLMQHKKFFCSYWWIEQFLYQSELLQGSQELQLFNNKIQLTLF